MMLYAPIALLVVVHTLYHLCTKSMPADLNTFAGLTATYLIAAVCSGIVFFISNRQGNLTEEYRHMNWASIALGLVVVLLEVGSIWMYKSGWNINTGQLLYSTILAIVLIVLGYFLYHETLTLNKVIGIILCLVGVIFINK